MVNKDGNKDWPKVFTYNDKNTISGLWKSITVKTDSRRQSNNQKTQSIKTNHIDGFNKG